MIELNGDTGEGGGAILRVGAGLACALQKPLKIVNIRANRKKPGLKLQHLVGLETLKLLTTGTSTPLTIGTTELEFMPGTDWIPSVPVEIRTAGNIGLLSQTLQNALIVPHGNHAKYTFNIKGGGTYGIFAPGTTYIEEITFHWFRQLGYFCHLDIRRQGFYPKGGARAILTIEPPQIEANQNNNSNKPYGIHCLQRSQIQKICVVVHVEERLRKPQVAERIGEAIHNVIKQATSSSIIPDYLSSGIIDIQLNYHQTLSVGVGIDAWIEYSPNIRLGTATFLGKRGLSSEKLGGSVGNALINILQGEETMDRYAADQILPVLMMGDFPYAFKTTEPSSHFNTNVTILDQILGKTPKIRQEGKYWIISND
ncbi:MAG: RNA 3'-terminal phosphate cyclase [Promethearchaeota archaeon]